MPAGSCSELLCKQKSKQPIMENRTPSRNPKTHRTLTFWAMPLIYVQIKQLISISENGKHWRMQKEKHQDTCLCTQVQASDFSIPSITQPLIEQAASFQQLAIFFFLFSPSFISLFPNSIHFGCQALLGCYTCFHIFYVWENTHYDLFLFQEGKYYK